MKQELPVSIEFRYRLGAKYKMKEERGEGEPTIVVMLCSNIYLIREDRKNPIETDSNLINVS